MIIYLDGKYLPEGLAKVSVFDHGLLYGDGVFEGIRAYNGRIFRLKEHLDRLFDSAKTIDIKPPISKEEMAEAICETMRRNNSRMPTSARSSPGVSAISGSIRSGARRRRLL